MDLFEYQAKELFARHGVPVPEGAVAGTPEDARSDRRRTWESPVVVKAQVKTGGRGKAGACGPPPARPPRRTRRGGSSAWTSRATSRETVLVESATGSPSRSTTPPILVDRANRRFLAMASTEGGMDIEEVAADRPEALVRMEVDPLTGMTRERRARAPVAARGFRPRSGRSRPGCWSALAGHGEEDALRGGHPAGLDRRRRDPRPRREGQPGRRGPPFRHDHAALAGQEGDGRAGVPRPRQGPELRQARRPGGRRRQRRGPGDEHPRRRRPGR